MEVQQQYWAGLKYKYEEKNQSLEQKQQELRARLEALEQIIGSSQKPGGQPLVCSCAPADDADNAFPENERVDSAQLPTEDCAPCQPEEERGGFLKCICSMLPGAKPKPPQQSMNEVPTKEVTFLPGRNSQPGNEEVINIVNNGDCGCAGVNINQPPQKVELDSGKICDFAEVKKKPSSSSLKSIDLFYMQNIQDLANKQKSLVTQINDLANKTRIYETVMKEYKNVDFSKGQSDCPCDQNKIKNDEADKRTNAELKLENFLLQNELKEMRMDVRQYLEKMEGPMQYKIESEKFKCHQLEQKLLQATQELAKTRTCYEEQLCKLKIQLCNATSKINKLTQCKEKLCHDLKCCRAMCAKLEDDIIQLKISEAETLKRLKACIDAQKMEPVPEECNLHEIARELSKMIKECEPCGECAKLPNDLTQAAKMLKSLTDLVDQKFTKDEGNVANCKADCADQHYTSSGAMNTPNNTPMTSYSSTPRNFPITSQTSSACGDVCGSIGRSPITIQRQPVSAPAFRPDRFETAGMTCTGTINAPCGSPPAPVISAQNTCDCGSQPEIKIEPLSDGCVCVITKPPSRSPPSPPIGNSCSCSSGVGKDKIKEFIPAASYNKFDCSCDVFVEMKKAAEPDPDLSCYCSEKKKEQPPPPPKVMINEDSCVCPLGDDKSKSAPVEQLYPTNSERLKVSHQVTASGSRDILTSATSAKGLKVKNNFPYAIDTKVDVIDKPPDGVHISTTITKSGCLEVVTEGPEGVVETTLIYTNSGNVEVVTEIQDYSKKGKVCNVGKIKAGSCVPAIGGPSGPSPDKCIEAPKITLGDYEDCDCNQGCPAVEENPLDEDALEASEGKQKKALMFEEKIESSREISAEDIDIEDK